MDVAIVVLPLLGALIAGLGNRRLGDRGAMWITSGLMLVSFVLSWIVFFSAIIDGDAAHDRALHLVRQPARSRRSGRSSVDTLSAVMLVVVTTVSAMVHVYSIGYMGHDHRKPRFMSRISACSPSAC